MDAPQASAAVDHAKLARSVSFFQFHIDDIEAQLAATDPLRVVSCVVPGYTDPPERIAAAEREREQHLAAGILHGPMTVEAVRAFEAGKLRLPEGMTGLPNYAIHSAKMQAVQYRRALEIAVSASPKP